MDLNGLVDKLISEHFFSSLCANSILALFLQNIPSIWRGVCYVLHIRVSSPKFNLFLSTTHRFHVPGHFEIRPPNDTKKVNGTPDMS